MTESFDYRRRPRFLCEFLWRFHLANAIERGFDPTITIASSEEEQLFKRCISEEVAFQLDIRSNDTDMLKMAVSQHYEEGKVYKVKVHGGTRTRTEEYLISVPMKSGISNYGKCTRGYWSVRVGSGRGEVAFLKDTWCTPLTSESDEGTNYKEIEGHVVNIPEVRIHGAVLDIEVC